MHYKTMIFDIDGTLTDSASAILYALRQAVLKITGKDYDEKELLFALSVPSHLAMKKLTGDRWREAMEVGQNYYQEGLKNIHLFDGIENTIKELYKIGTLLGIVTSKSRAEFQRSFFNYPIHPYFSHVICQDDMPYHKPDPQPLLACAKLFEADLSFVLYIGDTFQTASARKMQVLISLSLAGGAKTQILFRQIFSSIRQKNCYLFNTSSVYHDCHPLYFLSS